MDTTHLNGNCQAQRNGTRLQPLVAKSPAQQAPLGSLNVHLVIGLCQQFPALKYVGQLGTGNAAPLPILEAPRSRRYYFANLYESQLVNLDQIAAMARRRKRTMRDYRKEMPPPTAKGTGSIPDLWGWSIIRPWLMATFKLPKLVEKFPTALVPFEGDPGE
jgi:hypothetical protein